MEKPDLPPGFQGPFDYDIKGGKMIIKPFGPLTASTRNLPPMPLDLGQAVFYALNSTFSTWDAVKKAAEFHHGEGEYL